MSRTNGDICRDAAADILTGRHQYSCHALAYAAGEACWTYLTVPICMKYGDLFSNQRDYSGGYCLSADRLEDGCAEDKVDTQEVRALMLLMMAAIEDNP